MRVAFPWLMTPLRTDLMGSRNAGGKRETKADIVE